MTAESLSLAIAFAAGLVSFLSPCVLALLPVYLAFLSDAAAVPAAETALAGAPAGVAITARRSVLVQALLFVAGFSVIFILLGVSVGLLGSQLFAVPGAREVVGIAVIALGLVSAGLFGPVLDRLRMPALTTSLPTVRSARSLTLGALVAVGWTPCIGPVLGGILTLGASSEHVGVAALLLVAYSAGLAVPFLVAALALPRVRPLLDLLRRHHRAVQLVSGAFIVLIGVMILTNTFSRLASLFTLL